MSPETSDHRPSPIPIPAQIGRYQIVGRLGCGGMALVYDGYDPGVNRYAAVKVLHATFVPRPDVVEVFLQEARKVARLERHDGILTVYEVGEHGGAPFIAMQKIDGTPLDELLARKHGVLPCETVRRIFATIGGALAFAHKNGIVHCDIKPSNILIERFGRAFLTDFGISRARPDRLGVQVEGLSACTPRYASPEQLSEQPADARSDIYSLGVVLYEMCTGTTPFDDCDDLAELRAAMQDGEPCPPSRLNRHIPEALDRTILRALARQPENRHASAEDFVREVLAATDDERVGWGARAGQGLAGLPTARGVWLWVIAIGLAGGAVLSAMIASRVNARPSGSADAGLVRVDVGAAGAAPRDSKTAAQEGFVPHMALSPVLDVVADIAGKVELAIRMALRSHGAANTVRRASRPAPLPDGQVPAPAQWTSWEDFVEDSTRVPWVRLVAEYLAQTGRPRLAGAPASERAAAAPVPAVRHPPPAVAPTFEAIQRRAKVMQEQARRGGRR